MKTTPVRVTFRLNDNALALLREVAKKERRSMAAMMKIIVIEWVEAKKKGEGRDGADSIV